MASLQEKIDELSRRISELSAQQMHMGKQLLALMNELDLLKQQANASTPVTPAVTTVPEKVVEYKETISAPAYRPVKPEPVAAVKQAAAPKRITSFEEFIGKNLASKIGILVTIVGIFIGARYAIEHNMVSPVVRIVSGYAWGVVFVGVALWLKKKYLGYSAVLMGGGLCVLYFITYVAWSTYGLLPQMAAFGLMLLFTVVIVYMAVWYNQIIIAHLGQVGAYAIPFLLSNNSGRYELLFTYIAIINAGILVLSFYKYWKSLYHVAFALTWLIFGAWYFFQYEDGRHFTIAASFLAVFFLMFYATFLAYKLIRKEQYAISDIYLLLSNAFVFYAIGYDMLDRHVPLSNWQGAFTVVNALIHFVVSLSIKKLKLADRSLYYLVLGLVVVFLAIAVPVQFDGNWVTLLWIAEAVLLFAIGRTRNVPAYEKLAAPLTLMAFGSLVQDWLVYSSRHEQHSYFFFNIVFITGLLVAVALGAIAWLNHHKQWRVVEKEKTVYQLFFDYALPVLLLATCYFVFFLDIGVYFRDLEGALPVKFKNGLHETQITGNSFLFLYSEVFVMVLLLLYQRWIKSPWLAYTGLMGTVLLSVSLIIEVLPLSNEMMAADHAGTNTGYFGAWHAVVRYVSLGLIVLLFAMGSKEMRRYAHEPMLKQVWWLLVYGVLLGAISFEYLNWMTIAGKGNQYDIGLSVIWGLFALVLVGYGIRKKVKYIRLAAIVLFVITILKLFLYDLAGSGTLTITVCFISLGVILLLVSFLYNKYKEVLFGEEKVEA